MVRLFPNISNVCLNEFEAIFESSDTVYAGLKMVDAWGKFSSGFLRGRAVSLGDYDECVDIYQESSRGLIQGKYCYIPFLDLSPGLAGQGICIPHSCNLSKASNFHAICQTKHSYSVLDVYDYLAICGILLMFLIVLLSTLYDEWKKRFNEDGMYMLRIFSITSNSSKLFCTKVAPNQISCLAGFRSLAMVWIVAAHRYSNFARFPSWNGMDALHFYFDNDSFYITGAFTGIDTFVFISGFVVCYQIVLNIDKSQLKIKNTPFFYIHRILRLSPPMFVLYVFQVTLIRRLNSGPVYPVIVETARKNCLDNTLYYFFFLQNYFGGWTNEKCLLHTWYLNMDFQMYIFSPLMLIPLSNLLIAKNLKGIAWICGIFFALSLIIPSIIAIYVENSYYYSHTRIDSFVIGIVTGFIISYFPCSNKNISKWLNISIWIICLAIMTYCVYVVGQVERIFGQSYQLNASLYNVFGRTLWCLSLFWIIFSCNTNKKGILNRFLSHPVFLITGKLSFAIYLIHPMVIQVTTASLRTPIFFSFLPLLHNSISDLIVSTVFAILWVLCLESPVIAFSKYLYDLELKKSKKNREVTTL